MAGDEISMKVRQEHMPDLEAVPFGFVDIDLNIATRIDDRRRVRVFVPNEIGRLREALQVELLEDHGPVVVLSREDTRSWIQ